MVVIISGIGSGIGKAIFQKLAANNRVTKIIGISKDKKKLKKLSAEFHETDSYVVAEFLQADFSCPEKIKDLYKKIKSKLAKNEAINVLINNAGILINKDFNAISYSEMLQTFNVNLFSHLLLSQQIIPLMDNKYAHIVNISSMGGFQASQKYKGLSIYSASKAALANITESLSVELKDKNISVNCLALGAVQTEMFKKAFKDKTTAIKPDSIAEYIVAFSLKAGKIINGKILPISMEN